MTMKIIHSVRAPVARLRHSRFPNKRRAVINAEAAQGGRIYRRASESKDHQTAKDADLILTLLRNLSEEIQIEDDRLRHIA
jgi:hypothetical protein